MSRVAGGDADALGELYDHYGRVVFGVIYRMLGSPESAEEVAQNAFHSVWRQAAAYRPERGSVRTWLLAIARNAAIAWPRSLANLASRESATAEPHALVDDVRVEDRVIASLRAQRVRAAVASLPREQREVLSLAFWSGLSQAEIALRTGAPLGTVKSRVRLGMARLREWLGDAEEPR
jgi:RNA polymerase sigma-70 factor (ECF subfamily)